MKKIIIYTSGILLSLIAINALYPTIFQKSWWEHHVAEPIKKAAEPVAQSFEKTEPFRMPHLDKRYDQVSFLGSHNSFAALEEGFLYPQQQWSIQKQLDRGVRVLLPDFHDDSQGVARLCHNDCSISRALRAGTQNKTVLSFFQMLKGWLDANKDQIVTVEIENYIGNAKTLDLIKQAGLLPYALTPKDWDPAQHDQMWPTLRWMIQNNKRLVIFDTNDPQAYGFNTDKYMQRNQYGTHDKGKAAAPRDGKIISPKPRIFQLNYFGEVTSPLPIHNTPSELKKLIDEIRRRNYLLPGQQMNQIVLDYVDRGNPMGLVNELNQ